jgi:hypothetical protein
VYQRLDRAAIALNLTLAVDRRIADNGMLTAT